MDDYREKSIEELSRGIDQLNEGIKKSNSFKFSFLRGVLSGIGTAIGATIIAAIVIAILAKTIHSIQDVPVIGKIIKNTNIEQYIEKK